MSKKRKGAPEKPEAVEVGCPVCGYTQIIYIPGEDIPKCPNDHSQMIIRELLEEGKYI